MGVSFSCSFAEQDEVEAAALDSVTVKSISFGDDDECKTPKRSVNFNDGSLEPRILKSLGSGKMVVEKSVSFKGMHLERMISLNRSVFKEDYNNNKEDNGFEIAAKEFSVLDPSNPKHEAAIKLQKVYKSFRTRRKLADCAVLVEQSWWKLLDFAELKRSSISFFDIEKHETAISRWSRARTRAAKVGKGLSKNGKAQKLALQHWLEAIDPRHRYGHNLHFYYNKWLHCQSREPFFYWLDIGEGKEVNLVEKCPRLKLQQQCIKYLGPMERKAYEVVVEDGKFFYKHSGEILQTSDMEDSESKWIFVLSTSKVLYVGKKKKGTFQHSSFLAGGATVAAGRLVVENGVLKAVWPHSGHYQPTAENFMDFLSFLGENNVDITDVKMSPTDEDEFSLYKQRSTHMRNHSLEEELEAEKTIIAFQDKADATREEQTLVRVESMSRKQSDLETPEKMESFSTLGDEIQSVGSKSTKVSEDYDSGDDDEEEEEEMFDLEQESSVPSEQSSPRGGEEVETKESEVVKVTEESILKRINSKKETRSFQLGKQLSCKWTTGAGPRIGCVRDYPSELQFQALEQVNLSPRSASVSRLCFSSSSQMQTPQMSPLWRGMSLPANILHTQNLN
ncbi:PREDICTED: IQ domain-containing protein IQM2-like [Camelina sativa]|uniref:IQ domain-containing protein IQM2-like n=2 Tax=Camelina sativa TaxID=90675 RepID=A0ABM1QZK7_CAMSA|nr:PREDICTED: IQ domain-containing protein IQM2-like [Camelina sativa]